MAQPKGRSKQRIGRIGSSGAVDEVPGFVRLEREARESGEADDPRRTDRLAGLSPERFAPRVLAPLTPQASVVREAMAGVTEPDEAWEILAARGLIPVSWTSAGTRQIVSVGVRCDACGERVEFMGHVRGCEFEDTPATVLAAATLAADPGGVTAVETLARVCFERLYGDNATVEPRVLWRVDPLSERGPLGERRPGHARAKSHKAGSWEAFRPFLDALARRTDVEAPAGYRPFRDGYLVPEYIPVGSETWASRSPMQIRYAGWIDALHRDATHHWSWALSVREKRPNPFTPLCEAWALGYAIEVVSDELVLLYAPPLTL